MSAPRPPAGGRQAAGRLFARRANRAIAVGAAATFLAVVPLVRATRAAQPAASVEPATGAPATTTAPVAPEVQPGTDDGVFGQPQLGPDDTTPPTGASPQDEVSPPAEVTPGSGLDDGFTPAPSLPQARSHVS